MKPLFVLLVSTIILFSFYERTEAAMMTIDNNGQVVWNVLSIQDEVLLDNNIEDLDIRSVANVNTAGNDIVTIKNINGKVSLAVGSGDNLKEVEVEELNDTLVEVEERPRVQSLTIGKEDGKFTINQRGTTAKTILPIQINPSTTRLSLTTSTGESFLFIMPKEAVLSVLRSRVITAINYDKDIELVEDNEELVYKIPGQKMIPLLDFYNYSFDVNSYVSAQTGEIMEVEAPVWYKIFGFIITDYI